MTYLYGYATPTARLSLAELESRQQWKMLAGEFRRRLVAMFDASGKTVGIGGGWRSTAAQRTLFLSRYVVSPTGSITWEGQRWAKKPGVASAAPPGSSYHEESTRDGKALAADLIGDLKWVGANARRFGLHDFSDVNNEPWHVQPVEIPNSRRYYTGTPLPAWPLPEIEDDDVKYIAISAPGRTSALVAHSGAGIHMIGFASDADSLALRTAYGAPGPPLPLIPLSGVQYDDYLGHHK